MRTALAMLVAASAMGGCTTADFDPLKVQPKYKVYAANPFFDDGRAMRPLPPGTVSREWPTGDPRYTRGQIDGADVERIPLEVTPELLARGRRRFELTCAACHGLLGDGRSYVATQMSLRAPPSLQLFKDRPPGFFFGVISTGWGLMPAHGTDITVAERWAVVAYVRALLLSQSASLALAPAPERERLLRGGP